MPMRPLFTAVLFCTLLICGQASAVPFWGARQSSPAETAPADLKPGEWIWGGVSKGWGPMAVIVSLTEQRAYAYRNGILIGISTISSGKPGHETPTGVFTILQKDKDHRSNLYNAAPMPYQQRLTWDGVALHAGGLPGYPESHGCVHLPSEFARLLFDNSNMGMVVVVAQAGVDADAVVHPRALSPIDPTTGAQRALLPLPNGQTFAWQPGLAPTGPISMLVSSSDQQLVVYRNGVEIGRAQVALRAQTGAAPLGTQAFIVGQGFLPGEVPGLPGQRMPNWMRIGIPGSNAAAGQPLDAATIARLQVPPAFLAGLLPLLTPGVVLVATDQRILPETTGGKLQVLDSDPPEAP
ncbi:L,D-transpeptidase [Xanthomonas euroxanthea]|uniref:L,D-transpeptidase n=1 Tax=Xanthomonas euroxanthea TaxID=2259622 RepID=UPI001AF95C27|nr:L,D-transpeptidase [Xanthomonas euroxanthea]